MKKISFSVNDAQYEEIYRKSKENNQSMTDFILQKLGVPSDSKLTLAHVIDKVNTLKKGQEFSIPELFNKITEWDKFNKGSKLSIGKQFYKKVNDVNDNLSKSVKFLKKDSANLAKYKKI